MNSAHLRCETAVVLAFVTGLHSDPKAVIATSAKLASDAGWKRTGRGPDSQYRLQGTFMLPGQTLGLRLQQAPSISRPDFMRAGIEPEARLGAT